MLPAFTAVGVLPAGIHAATWADVETVLGFNEHRRRLLAGLRLALDSLAAAGCRTAYLDGSYVTDKEFPGDYDLCWDPAGVVGTLLDPVLLDLAPPRTAQKAKYRGDILPNVIEASVGSLFVEFFQIDRTTGGTKGIVMLDLGATP